MHMADHPTPSQYAAAAHVPLIKSPVVRVPLPVELPPDIHPLPDSVTPYFAYPFALEPHVLTLEASRRNTLATYVARREGLIRSREDEKEQRRREALKRVAPGFDGNGTPLEPVRHSGGGAASALERQLSELLPATSQTLESRRSADVMNELVEELERMTTGTRTAR